MVALVCPVRPPPGQGFRLRGEVLKLSTEVHKRPLETQRFRGACSLGVTQLVEI